MNTKTMITRLMKAMNIKVKREVKIGQTDGVRTEILSGLKAGECIVTEGAYQVKLAASSSAIPEGHNHNH